MTSSFQSTAFQSSASPVDTFVRPPSVQPKTDIEQLAEALQSINPAIQSFIGSRLEKAVEKEEAEGTELAIEDAAKNFKDISRGVKKADGEDAARQLIGGSIFADRAYQRTKTEILGSNLASTLSNSYATTQVDGRSLNAFSLQSPQFQTWLEGERTRVVDQLGDINPTYVNKYFLPKLADATATVTSSHIKQHQEYNLEKLKNLAVPLVKGLIVSDDETDLQLITNFEQSMNNLGLVTKDRSDLNKTIVGVLIDQAEAVGLSSGGDIEGAQDILDIALKFPYGADGKLNLTAHPDYQGKVNKLKKSINDHAATEEKRRKMERERIKEDDIINTIKTFAETGDANLITALQKKYPLEASKIGTAGVALDGNTRERSAQLESRIIEDGYASKKDAANAALSWYLDERTPKTQANRARLSQLLTVANSSENGDFTDINKTLTEAYRDLKGIFTNDNYLIKGTDLLNDKGSSELSKIFSDLKLELYGYRLSPEGNEDNRFDRIKKAEEIKRKYLDQAQDKMNLFKPESGVGKDNNDLSDLEGDAAFASEDDDTPTTVTVEQGDTLTQLADSFSTTVEAIKKANNLTNENLIQIGQELIMPIVNTAGDALTSESDLKNRSVLEEIDITKPIAQPNLERLAIEGGFTSKEAKIMAAIAMAESSGLARALNDDLKTGDNSFGLWQINMIDTPNYKLGEERRKKLNIESNDELYNPAVNVRAAKMIFDEQGFDAWSVYKSGAYKQFLSKTN